MKNSDILYHSPAILRPGYRSSSLDTDYKTNNNHSMQKVIEKILTTPSARNASTAKQVAASEANFIPWEGTPE